MTQQELLQGIKLILEAPKQRYFCEDCGVTYGEDDTVYVLADDAWTHKCPIDTEARSMAFVKASWRFFYGNKAGSRARGYRVR